MKITLWFNSLLLLALFLPSVGQPSLAALAEELVPSEVEETREQQVRRAYTNLPFTFIKNQGQRDVRVAYYVQQGGASVYFTAEEVVMTLPETVLRTRFVDANPAVLITGAHPQKAIFNYFVGNDPEQWYSEIRSYGKITYHDLYPGVDLTYTGRNEALKYEFVLQPGAEVDAIRLAYAGADEVRLAENGDLLVMPEGTENPLRDAAPYAYQEFDGARVPVNVVFTLYDDYTYGFMVGAYDPRVPLVIDPTLLYSTLLGGSDWEYGHAIALDDVGNAYVMGETKSTNFPTTTGAYTTTYQGGNADVFVSVLSSDLSTLLYSTFLGGSGTDVGRAIALDDVGNVYITGDTGLAGDFPTTVGAYTTTHQTSFYEDVFLSVFNSDLSTLSYSTFLGGCSRDYGHAIALDDTGNVYITGYTFSDDFPATTGAYTTTHQGPSNDVFVSVLDPEGNGTNDLLYSTFLGGSAPDFSHAIALDDVGNVYVTGNTDAIDFPATSGAYTTTHHGVSDVFVSVFTANLSTLSYSTFLGGSEADIGHALTLDGEGNVYVGGSTESSDFPATPGAYDTSLNEDYYQQDTFVAMFDPTLSNLSYATFLGGSMIESFHDTAIALDSAGNVFVTADTASSDFPTTTDAYTTAHQGGADVFLSVFSSDLSNLSYSTFFGGSADDFSESIALDGAGNAYVMGFTNYVDVYYNAPFPTTPGAYTTTYQGGADIFVTKFGPAADLSIDKTVLPTMLLHPGDVITYTLTFSNVGALMATNVVITDHVPVSVSVRSVISSGIAITDTGASWPYVWNVTDLAQNEGGIITITGVLNAPLAMGIFTNTAIINTTTPESSDANNRDEVGVTVPNVAPIADDNHYNTNEDTPLNVSAPGVLDGDSDANGDPLTVVKDSGPTSGALALENDGSFVYTPTLNYSGVVTFTYHASDTISDSNVALVTITVNVQYEIYLPLVLRY